MEELALHLLELLENSLNAGATEVELLINENMQSNVLLIELRDNGKGMSPEMVEKVVDPFVTTRVTRRIGLGLSLLMEATEACNGKLEIRSHPGKGTIVVATMQNDHWDRPPMGDVAGTIVTFLASAQDVSLKYTHFVNGSVFTFDTVELSQSLGGASLKHPQVLYWLKKYLDENIKTLLRGGQG